MNTDRDGLIYCGLYRSYLHGCAACWLVRGIVAGLAAAVIAGSR